MLKRMGTGHYKIFDPCITRTPTFIFWFKKSAPYSRSFTVPGTQIHRVDFVHLS